MIDGATALDRCAQLVRDALEHGVEVRPIDVNASGWDNTLEGIRVLRLGLRQIELAGQECPQAEVTSIALEFGTVPTMDVIDALRADQWLENHPEADEAKRKAIKQRLRDAFYTDTPDWKRRIVEQAREVAQQALHGIVRN